MDSQYVQIARLRAFQGAWLNELTARLDNVNKVLRKAEDEVLH